MNYLSYYKSPLGNLTLTSNGSAITGLFFENQKYCEKYLSKAYEKKKLLIFEQSFNWLDIYFSGKQPDFIPTIEMSGTDFRKKVWEILLTIPYGRTSSYKEIASIISKGNNCIRMSAQAIGGAVSHNPISIIVPCHRVIGTNGSLMGYASGIEKKIYLLNLEKSIKNTLPKKSSKE